MISFRYTRSVNNFTLNQDRMNVCSVYFNPIKLVGEGWLSELKKFVYVTILFKLGEWQEGTIIHIRYKGGSLLWLINPYHVFGIVKFSHNSELF